MAEKEMIDALWLFLAAILVLLMQAGFLCIESGLTRSKNAINVALKNAFDLLLVVLLYWLVGFALMFGESSNWLPEIRWLAANFSDADLRQSSFFFFQLTFCATAATILSGAIAERSRFVTYVLLIILVTVLIYPVAGHWSWSGAFNSSGGWLENRGFVDFAGSTVVHSLGGWVALAGVLVIGPRKGRFDEQGRPQEIPGSNLPMALLGMLFFVFGWLGFNGGSTLAFSAEVPGIVINTLLAGAAGGITAMLMSYQWLGGQKVAPLTINGTLAGLVAITAGAHAVSTLSALVIGALGSVCMLLADQLMLKQRLDDAVSAVPVHLAAGIWGTLAVALFGVPEKLGTGLGFFAQLQVQAMGILATGFYAFTLTLVFLLLLRRWMPLRVSPSAESDGLNVSEHGARTELNDLLFSMAAQEKSGDLQQRMPVEPFTEVGQIAAQYNRVMDKLNRMMNRTRLIVRDIRDGVITFNSQGTITSVNPGAEHLFGKTQHELIGQPTHSLLHRDCRPLYPRIQPEQLFPALAAGVSEGPHELVLRHQDGHAFHVEISTAASPTEAGVQYSAVIREIGERKRMEAQLHRHSELAQVTLEAIMEGVITCDARLHTVYLNPVASQLTGWNSREAFGKPIDKVVVIQPGEGGSDVNLAELCKSTHKHCLQLVARNGEVADVEVTPAPLHDHQGQSIGWVLVMQDVTQSNRLQQQLSFQAIHDTLTGLVNRREFEQRLHALIQDVGHNESEHVLCYLDLDQFKIVNDTCGHRAGDLLLRQLADSIKPLLRQSDTLARLGGDEFGVLLGHCPLDRGQQIAERLRQAVCDFRFTWEGRVFLVGASIGLVHLAAPCGTLDEVLSHADTACYAAKNLGRNRVHLYAPDSTEVQQQTQQVQWVNRIQQALDQDLFRLYCQPVVPLDVGSEVLPHYEILLRLQDPQGQLVPPGAFIPSAERFNLMPQIDAWVIRNSLAWLGDQLRASNQPLLCAINLSGASIGDPQCLQIIRQQLEKHRVPGHYICFEITETVAMADLMRARDFIHELKKLGCRFALDDFGSGLSSFGYLKQLPVDYLKIDGIFIRELVENPIDQAMVASINNIGHIMGLKTIAEYVENGAILELLGQLDVDFAQGFHLGRPQPLEQLASVRVMPR